MSLPRFGRRKESGIDYQTKEFKIEAVRLAQKSGRSLTQLAREMGISDSALSTWRKQLAEEGEQAFAGFGHQTELEEENRR